MPTGRKQVKAIVAFACFAAGVVPWLFPSNVLRLVANQEDVLLGRYSLDRFSTYFGLTLIAWAMAACAWRTRTRTLRQVTFQTIAITLSIFLAVVVVDVAGRLLRKPRYIEERTEVRDRWPAHLGEGVLRHRPPDRQYQIRYTDAPRVARSYPDPPPGHPPVECTLTTDHRGYRNLDRLDQVDVVAVGDSYTEGSRVSDDQPWPVLVAARRNQTVYNLGMSGGSPPYYLQVLRTVGLSLGPKIAIVMIYEGNDLRGGGPRSGSGAPLGKRIKSTLQVSPVVLALTRTFVGVFGRISADGPIPGSEVLSWMPVAAPPGPNATYYAFQPKRLLRLYVTPEDFRRSSGWRGLEAAVREIKALCDGGGIRVVFAYAPSKCHVVMPLVKDEVTAAELHAFASFKARRLLPPDEFKRHFFDLLDSQETVIREFCAAEGIEFVSATKPLGEAMAAGRQVYYTYDQHWTALGHEVVAEELVRHLERTSRPEAPRTSTRPGSPT